MGLWDLRQRAPLLVKDHMYGAAIRDIKFHSGGVSRERAAAGGWLELCIALLCNHTGCDRASSASTLGVALQLAAAVSNCW